MKAAHSPAEPGRLIFLDFVRVIAILGIILFHFHPAAFMAGAAPGTVPELKFLRQSLGDLGVTLFIIVSATALMTSNARHFSIGDFYVKRFLAIFPSYWTAYALVAAVLFISKGNWAANIAPWKFAYSAIGFDGFIFHEKPSYYLVGEWFVGFILCLYALFPILRRGVNERPVATVCAIGILFVVLHFYYAKLFTTLENQNPLMRLPEFFFGLCFLRYLKPHLGLLSALSSMIIAALIFWAPSIPLEVYGILLGITCFCLLSFIASLAGFPQQIAKWLAAASRASFLAFLVHHQIIQAVRAQFPMPLSAAKTAALFLLVVAASFLVAALFLPVVDRLTGFMREKLRSSLARKRAVLAGLSAVLLLLAGGLANDIGSRSPSMDRKLALLSSRLEPAMNRPRQTGFIDRWAEKNGVGVYASRWWQGVGTIRYREAARNDSLCTGSVDAFNRPGSAQGAQGWVKVSQPAADVLIVLTDAHGKTVGWGVSGGSRPDVARSVPGAGGNAGWLAIAAQQPSGAYALVDGAFCKL